MYPAGVSDTCAEFDDVGDSMFLDIGFLERIDSLNPYIALKHPSKVLLGMIYDCLFSYDENLVVVPNLAVDWHVVEDAEPYGSVWEYDLTQNAAWHDGEPFTADDVVFTLDLQTGDYWNIMWMYQPYTLYIDHAERVDTYTVRIHFCDPEGAPSPCSFGNELMIPILPEHVLSSYTPIQIGFDFTNPHPIGTGPFKATENIFDDFVEGENLTLLRNSDYHGQADNNLGVDILGVVMRFYDDASEMRTDLLSGVLDLAEFPPPIYESIEQEIGDGECPSGLAVSPGPKANGETVSLLINMKEESSSPWLGDLNLMRLDPTVRMALDMATDRESIVALNYRGYGEIGSTVIPSYLDWHCDPIVEESRSYDLAAASALLEDVGYMYLAEDDIVRVATEDSLACIEGWAAPGDPLTFTLLVESSSLKMQEIAESLQEAWMEIGIEAAIVVRDESIIASTLYMYGYDLALREYSCEPNPHGLLHTYSSYALNAWSLTFYHSAEYDANYSESVTEMTLPQRMVVVEGCQRTLYEDIPVIPIAYEYQTYVWNESKLLGWGDWNSHPGRTLDNIWGANPLFFDLTSVGGDALVQYEREGCFRMMVPGSWALTEDEVIEGSMFELHLEGPVHDGTITNVLVNHESGVDVEASQSFLESEMETGIEELNDQGYAVNSVGTSTYWETECSSCLMFSVEWEDLPIRQAMALFTDVADDELWVVTFTAHSGSFEYYEAIFTEMAESFEVIESGDGSDMWLFVVIGALAAAVAVSVAAALMITSRNKRLRGERPPGAGEGGQELPP